LPGDDTDVVNWIVINWNVSDDVIQVEERLSDVDLTDGHFVEFVGKSSAAATGFDRWTGFEYTPVHLSYR